MDTFASLVHRYFDEIADSHSMRRAEEEEYHVRYENDRVSFGVGWDRRRSYELGVSVGLKSAGRDALTFDLWDILRFQGAAETRWVGGLSVDPQQDLQEPIRKLANLTRSYGHLFLQGDADAFKSIAEFTGRSPDRS
jgi:hypothetical protein